MFGLSRKQVEKSPALHAGQLQPRIKYPAFERALQEAGIRTRRDNHRLSAQVMIRRDGIWRLYDGE